MDTYKKPAKNLEAPAWQDKGLEFELTDLEDARRVLDNESMSQFDMVSIGAREDDQWKRMRRKKVPTDRALGGQAIDWLIGLPTSVRPVHLGTKFPRVANALAEVWDDLEERTVTLHKLLFDERRGRKGFPPEVHQELLALRDWMVALGDWNEPF